MSTIQKDLGTATAYGYAKDGGYTGTEAEFTTLMASYATVAGAAAGSAADAETDALKAEGYAVGKQNGADVASGSAYYQANAKYYSEQANSAKTDAETAESQSEGFAVGQQEGADVSSGSPYYHNNAKYYKEQAASSASSASGSATNAGTDALKSEGFAVGKQGGTDVASGSTYYQNNAKYYAEQAASSAAAADASAQSLDDDTIVYKDDLEETLEDYAHVDGYYDEMAVGSAEQLISTVTAEDQVPYNFRTAGGSADIGNRETDMIVGGTVAWNQLVNGVESFSNTQTDTKSRLELLLRYTSGVTGSFLSINPNTPAGLLTRIFKVSSSGTGWHLYHNGSGRNISIWSTSGSIPIAGHRYLITANFASVDVATVGGVVVNDLMLFDLTQMFGSTIADYIYTLEQTTAGAGVAWFKKLFPKEYYEYNAGELMSVNVSEHSMVGFNAYDNTTGKAVLLGGNQYQISGTYTSISYEDINGNAEAIMPDGSGLFTPTNNGTLTVAGGNGTDTCVHLVWSGYRNGEYKEYDKHSYALDDSLTLRGIPKLDANNNLYYDGDTYESDGTVTRKYGVRAYTEGDATNGTTMMTDGANTVYALVASTTETAAPYTNPQIVDDFGTEEYVDAGVEAGDRDVAIPVGHTTLYMANLRDKLQHLPNLANADGDYIIHQSDSQMALVPLADVKELPDAPTTDGTYVLKCTVSEGTATLSWEAES